MAKEYLYQGKKLEELQEMSLNELSEILPAAQRRKLKRGLTDNEKKLLKKLEKKNDIKTHERQMIILPQMVGKTLRVHCGKSFEMVVIQEEMMGHALGEFVLTRKRTAHNAPGVGATKSSSSVSVR